MVNGTDLNFQMLCQHCMQDERHVAMVCYLLCYQISFIKILPRIFVSVFMRGLKWNFLFKKIVCVCVCICVYDMCMRVFTEARRGSHSLEMAL